MTTTSRLPTLLSLALSLIAPALLAQGVAEFDVPTQNARPYWLATGGDGAVWFTMSGVRSIGRVRPDGAMTAFGTQRVPRYMTAAPNGKLWFTAADSPAVGVMEPDGTQSKFLASSDSSPLRGITTGGESIYVTTGSGKVVQLSSAGQVIREAAVPPESGPEPSLAGMTTASDGRVWFADQRAGAPRLGRFAVSVAPTPGGPVTTVIFTFVALPPDTIPFALAAGDNGAVWFTDRRGSVGRVTREGVVSRVAMPRTPSGPLAITRAVDGGIWFTESSGNRVGRIDPSTLAPTEIELQTPNSLPAGITSGADGAIWFAEMGTNRMARIGTPSAGADLAVTIEGPDFANHGGETTPEPSSFTVTVRNIGTEEARDVTVVLAGSGVVQNLVPSQGECTDPNAGPCILGTIASGASATVSLRHHFYVHNPVTKNFDRPTDEPETAATATTSSGERNFGNNHASMKTFVVECNDLGNCPIAGLIASEICESRIIAQRIGSGTKSLSRMLAAEVAGVDLDVFYGMRDRVFSRTAAGRRYTELYYAHGREIARAFFFNPTAGAQALDTVRMWQEPLRALVNGDGSSVAITPAQIAALQTVLDNVKRLGSAELRAVVEREEAKLQLASLAGQTMEQALARQTTTAPATITLPAAASLHGIPPAFFHSDVRVFNPTPAAIDVTARYRCFSGSCGAGVHTFTVAPGEMKIFDDMVARQFGAPESGGAIEFEGDVIVDSRLYTPEAGAPTTGMYVPAVNAGAAFAESVLLSLSHSADQSRGFRTNVGAYNPNDTTLDVLFILYDRLGREIGRVTRSLPARIPVQVNNIFAAAGAAGDFDGAYCVIRADGIRELFAYASVIDNQSQDLIFVGGRNRGHGSLTKSTLAAAASLHGIPPSFFHSDVTVLNPSSTQTAHVTARYRCFIGSCGSGLTTFDVAPGETRVFEDAPVSLFGAPESGGAIEFEGAVLVDSRLYTPSRPAPSSGMYVPAAQDDDAHAESVLLSLSHSADQSRGFRTNAGAYNPNPVALDVTFTLFDPTGRRLGEVTRQVPARTPMQVNNIFAVAGLTADVPSAYCVIRADGLHPLFAFASVIDNRSQDLIFVRGSRR